VIELTNKSPRIFFKYRDWNNEFHKRILTDNEVYFATANQFNDPFDASLPFTYDASELTDENIFKKLIETRLHDFPQENEEDRIKYAKERAQTVDFRSQEYWDKMYPFTRDHLHKHFGIYSLARRRDNLLMWAHYANSHRGFSVGIKKSSLKSLRFTQLLKVEYSNQFPQRPMFISDDEQTKYLLKIITTKSKHWSYEREYRLINMIFPNTPFRLKDDFVSEICLGLAMNEESKEEIKTLWKEKFPQAKLFQTSIDTKKFSLKFIEIKK